MFLHPKTGIVDRGWGMGEAVMKATESAFNNHQQRLSLLLLERLSLLEWLLPQRSSCR